MSNSLGIEVILKYHVISRQLGYLFPAIGSSI